MQGPIKKEPGGNSRMGIEIDLEDEMEGVVTSESQCDGLRGTRDGVSSPRTLPNLGDDLRTRQQETPLQNGIFNDADDGIKTMGRDVAAIADAMAELRALGVSANYGVPELCALGEQSAGKSSVIGALAGINLPSGSGTCTRVPVQIKTRDDLTLGGSWTCRILLELAYGHSRTGSTAADASSWIGHWWKKQTPDTIEFMEIADKGDLEMAMRAAQQAILNPQNDPDEYKPNGKRWNSTTMLEHFSPNCLVLDISEPGHQTLSFIDLPGIIQNDKSQSLVDVVAKLVKHFIKRKNTLLLCVVPMSGDPQNSIAIRFVREAKAIDRCLGVLTKPDLLIESGGAIRSVWLPLLRGRKEGFEMAHNYYVTKQPDGDREITQEQARIEEDNFFNNTPPWTTDLNEFLHRCGTKKLREVLSRKLANCIKLELPNIRLNIQNRAAEIDGRLKMLPKPAEGDIQRKVLRTLQQFSKDIERQMDVRSNHSRDWRDIRRQFRDAVALLKPIIGLRDKTDEVGIPPPTPQKEKGRYGAPEPIEIGDSSDDNSVITSFPMSGRKRDPSPDTPVPPKRRKVAPSSATGSDRKVFAPRPMSPLPERTYFAGTKGSAVRFTLGAIDKVIYDFSICNLPGEIDPEAKVHLCRLSVEPWKKLLEILLDVIQNQLRTLFKDVLTDTLVDYVGTDLCIEAEKQVKKLLDKAISELTGVVNKLFEIEHHSPSTVNEDLLDHYRREALAKIKTVRRKIRVKAHQDRLEKQQQRYTYGLQRANVEAKITDADLTIDLFEKQIECVAHVQGYYKLASGRFVDNVCQVIQSYLFNFIKGEIPYYLERELGLGGADGVNNCVSLVSKIDPGVAAEREGLHREKTSLQSAHERLQKLFEQLALEDRRTHQAVPDRSREPSSFFPEEGSTAFGNENAPKTPTNRHGPNFA